MVKKKVTDLVYTKYCVFFVSYGLLRCSGSGGMKEV